MRTAGVLAISVAFLWAGGFAFAPTCAGLAEVRDYIKRAWTTLERSDATLLESAVDTKVPQSGPVTLYAPADADLNGIRSQLQKVLPPAAYREVQLLRLPPDGASVNLPGLLYLPSPYVVPGGRFNEMYGWDSFFILLGLIRDGRLPLAKDMTDNFVYEVEHYGKVLNANRTYYLTRSQPPFLTRMILDVYEQTSDRKWLEGTLDAVEKYYRYWTTEPHFVPETGLSRYYGGADTPAPEVVYGERDGSGKNDYDRIREYYRTHPVTAYNLSLYYNKSTDRLTPLFYEGDRAVRESGFDPSGRFGPFSIDIIHYNPVDLNSLLYRMEMDTAAICTLLHRPRDAQLWTERAEQRAAKINQLMWNAKAGLYFDYNFDQKRQSDYRFVTTFYPLWAGIATPEQAAKVAANLPIFERAGGLQTSDSVTGDQWDAPYGWAPMQIIANEGLRRYGFTADADRLSVKFLSMILRDFALHNTIKEKYDVVKAASDLGPGIKFGYESNEIGFGWTNAAFVVLYDELTPAGKEQLKLACGPAGLR